VEASERGARPTRRTSQRTDKIFVLTELFFDCLGYLFYSLFLQDSSPKDFRNTEKDIEMRVGLTIFVALFLLACSSERSNQKEILSAINSLPESPTPVDTFQSKKRLLLVWSPLDKRPYERQLAMIDAPGRLERDLLLVGMIGTSANGIAFVAKEESTVEVLYIDATSLSVAELVSKDGFRAVLIGKDGEVKASWSTPVSQQELFGLIDAMPMRQQERLR